MVDRFFMGDGDCYVDLLPRAFAVGECTHRVQNKAPRELRDYMAMDEGGQHLQGQVPSELL